MKKILQRLFQQETLSYEEAKNILLHISEEAYNTMQVACFLTVFQMRPIRSEELRGFKDALLELAVKMDFSDFDSVDLCGTGGDGKDTFNISTLAAIVTAGAGYPVTKHGNYGVSSICGSSNVLEELGYQFTNNEATLKRQLEQYNLCFLHAPLFHPAMKAVAPIRQQLGVRTFFNLLGPLVNPIQPKRQLVGVSSLETVRLYHAHFQQTQTEFALVHALDGYDEVSLTGNFKLITNKKESLLEPQTIQQHQVLATDLTGGTSIKEAAQICINILKGQGTTPQNEVVCTNAGIAIQRFQPERDLLECIQEAKDALLSQKAYNNFKALLN